MSCHTIQQKQNVPWRAPPERFMEEQWLNGNISPSPPAAALIGLQSPTNCPFSVATTRSSLSQLPLPAPWSPSADLPLSFQLHEEAGLPNCPWSPGIRLPPGGWLQPSPGPCLGSVVCVISAGKTNCLPRSTCISHPFPGICWRSVLSSLHRGHLASFPNHWERFVISCPYQEAESCLWSSADVCPVHYPACGVFPSGRCPLFALGLGLGN